MDIASSPVTLTLPLEPDTLRLSAMRGTDRLSELFEYKLEMLGEGGPIRESDLLGQPVTVSLERPNGVRYMNGLITEFELVESEARLAKYRATARPWLWLLTLGSDCRIFQNLSVPEIVRRVLRNAGHSDFEERIIGDYERREFVVQYCESDYNFICRLLEEEGIYFFFRHDEDRHTLVLADSCSAHDKLSGYEELRYDPLDAHRLRFEERVYGWRQERAIRPGAASSTDFDFERPRMNLHACATDPEKHNHAEAEAFVFPGGYVNRAASEEHVRRRLEQLKATHQTANGATNAVGLLVGNLFRLANHPIDEQNRDYLVTAAELEIHAPDPHSLPSGDAGELFRCTFSVLDSTRPFRPPMRSRKPRIVGPQTAIVTGNAGEEVWTDQYGRVKLHFHWDRYGAANENSSCWVRVAQTWAGSKWGSIHIPRVGQEVIVEFLDGDPDRPIVTGRVYNGDNMPPYDLPANYTQSGFKSMSSKGGDLSTFNEIRFEDKKGQEELHVQAEKNHTVLVKNDQSIDVKNDRTATIGGNDSLSVIKDRSVHVRGNLSVCVDGGGAGAVQSSLSVTGKHHTHASDTIDMDAPTHIRLQCGGSSILIEPGKITLMAGGNATVVLDADVLAASAKGGQVLVNSDMLATSAGGGQLLVDANVTGQSAGGSTLVLDGNATISTPATATVTGTTTLLNGDSSATVTGGGAGLEATGDLSVFGGQVDVSGDNVNITGGLVKVN